GLARLHPNARERRRPPRAARARRHPGADPLSPRAKAETVLRRDPVMARLVDAIGPLSAQQRRRGRPPDAYGALVRSIVGQQLSTKAARTITDRVVAPYGSSYVLHQKYCLP